MLVGEGASNGIGFGHVFLIQDQHFEVSQNFIKESSLLLEIEKLDAALLKSKNQLQYIFERVLEKQGADEAAIFEAHQMLLMDPAVIKDVKKIVSKEQVCSEYAYKVVTDRYIKKFEDLEDDYFKERALDIKDIAKRVLSNLMGVESVDLSSINCETVLVARDLTPSQAAMINPRWVKGIVTEQGGRSSHTAIMARTLEVPAIMGVKNLLGQVHSDEFVCLDGKLGEFYLSPSEEVLKQLQLKAEEIGKEKEQLKKYIGKKSLTLDGHQVLTMANIGRDSDIESLERNDAEGVGLFRTEFLFMEEDRLPSENKQFELYKKVAESLGPKELIIRTLDIGGDKQVDYLNIEKEENPFLGHRAIRYCLENRGVFKTQLRAILRASSFGNVKIMFPMISGLEELLAAKEILRECKDQLSGESISFNTNIPVGVMIEIPSAAIMSDILAKEVSFFSIGTNDLIQYMIAADRMNEKVGNLYTHYHPAVLRMIDLVIRNGKDAGIKVGMCGGMAANPILVELLLGMGLDSFSMEAGEILKIRKIIRKYQLQKAKEMVGQILQTGSAKLVEEKLRMRYRNESFISH